MELVQVHIKNFKKFEDVVIPITKNHLILGANNSGKSSILQAIDLALKKEPCKKEDINGKGNVEITLNFNDNKNLRTLIYKSAGTKATTKQIMKPNEWDFSNLHIYIPSELFKPEELAQTIAIQNSDKIQEKIQELEQILKKDIDKLLNDDYENYSVFKDGKTIFTPETQIKPVTKIKTDKNNLPLEQQGEGYRKNISISLLKKLRKSSTLIMIDEIENHFSIPNVRNLVSIIVKNNNSMILTSHRLETRISDIIGITFLGNNTYDIGIAIKSLDIEVNKYSKIILVEGKTDIFYFNKYIEVKKEIDDFQAIVVYTQGEGNMLKVYEKLSETIDPKKIVAIKDGDQKNKAEKNINYLKRNEIEEYRNDFNDIKKECNGNESLAKSIASLRLDFLTKDSDLYKEIDIIVSKN